MKPRYSDGRYPHGYRPAVDTDIRKTFERVRKERREKQEALSHVLISIQRKKA